MNEHASTRRMIAAAKMEALAIVRGEQPLTEAAVQRARDAVAAENALMAAASASCQRCCGCGKLANSDDQEPWTEWLALPLQSSLAVVLGLVRPIPCHECGGTGKRGLEGGQSRG
jgi:hypothetical protein